jgi:hypothetical protein
MVPEVADLAVNPHQGSEYLLGQQPIWADVQSGRAVERDNDEELWALVEGKSKHNGVKGAIISPARAPRS